ncbi:MAG: AAA family ATPase, partial [Clostridia bacterium]|nr:AAA family ATPase [Clostridia bacterium]
MEDVIQFANGSEYLDRLIFLARHSLQCTISELGYDSGNKDLRADFSRSELRTGFEKAYAVAGKSLQKGLFLPLEYLFWLFNCDAFERHAVVMTLLSQVFPEAAADFALIHNHRQLDWATPLALCRTYEEHGEFAQKLNYFAKDSKLIKYFFAPDEVNVLSKLTLDRRILEFILGTAVKESYYAPTATLWSGGEQVSADEKTAGRLAAYIRDCQDFGGHTVFNLFGEKGAGRKSCIKYIAGENGFNLMFIDLLSLSDYADYPVLIGKVLRECLIFQAVPVIVNIPEEMTATNRDVFFRLHEVVTDAFDYSFAVSGGRLLPNYLKDGVLLLAKELGNLSLETAVRLWERESQKYSVDKSVSFYELAGEFKLTPGNIKDAFRAASAIANLEGSCKITLSHLKRGCYNTLPLTMSSKATRLEPVYTWDDLVLPQYQKDLLVTACNQVRYKYFVYQKWGFQDKIAYGKSVSMLFTGPPGTGKTMAAQVVANELGLDVYKIELATVVSKYVGETEKNLNEIFQQAQKSQVILFFDEADVLFSKRTEVKESTDKYSNMEAAFLLQKMEEYDGVAILATNYIQNFDEAFKRRLKFVIDFPFPNREQRRQIWKKVFPPQLPLGELDYDYLTSRFELSGSNIKNIALYSAFLAAAEGSERVEMKHVMAAIRNEYAKSGKMFT